MCCACGGGATPPTHAPGSSWAEQCAFTSLACATYHPNPTLTLTLTRCAFTSLACATYHPNLTLTLTLTRCAFTSLACASCPECAVSPPPSPVLRRQG